MINAMFTPQKDITAYELAVIVASLVGMQRAAKYGVSFTQAQWDGLPAEIRRHFTVKT